MKKILFTIVALLTFTNISFAAIKTQEIDYKAGDTTLKGYLAYDDANNEKRPAVLVVHEWWGHNEYSRQRARMLAELGYVAFAVDMYGDGKQAQHPDEAGAFMQAVASNAPLSEARFKAAYDVIKNFELTDATRISAIGYCFGGGTVLKMAMAGMPLKAVVSFHGALNLPETLPKPGDIKAKILVCHGADDGFETPEQIAAFKDAMTAAQADYSFKVYPGAKHGFTNPSADEYAEKFDMPIAYNAAADKASWEDMKAVLSDTFGK